MSANVETMFSVRETPWHGLGRIVIDAPASREADKYYIVPKMSAVGWKAAISIPAQVL